MQQRSTSLILIVFILVAGTTLGWLGRDRLFARQPLIPSATQPAPTAAAAVPTLTPSTPPIAVGSPVPTAMPVPTAQPTRKPKALLTATEVIAPTLVPAVTAAPAPTGPPAVSNQVIGYIGHTVTAGEMLASIAATAGSSAEAIARYNLLSGEPAPGRALIIPQLAGSNASLQSTPQLVRRGRSDKPWVALTLDAGAGSAPVASILQTLRERNIKLTFFLTGKWIRENPDLVRQIVADGHEIGNHTFNHPDLRHVSSAVMREELGLTEALLRETAGAGATTKPFFRPPYGAYDERVLNVAQAEGYLPIYWTLDSLDSVGEPKTAAFLLDRVTNKLTPEQLRGAIILAHCGSTPTAEALPQILDRFAAMGFEVHKLSDVL